MKQFSIRDLLFLVVIIAIVLGWWLDKRPRPARYRMEHDTANRVWMYDTATGQVWTEGMPEFMPPKATK